MGISEISSSANQTLHIYADGLRTKSELLEKMTRISLELKTKSDSLELAQKALRQFYA